MSTVQDPQRAASAWEQTTEQLERAQAEQRAALNRWKQVQEAEAKLARGSVWTTDSGGNAASTRWSGRSC